MPTARELLEQADALMRRNRATAVDDIPVLTDSVALPVGMPAAASAVPAFSDVVAPPPRGAGPVPTLTEAVAVAGDETGDSVIQEGEPSDWLHLDRDSPSIIGDAPDSIAFVPQVARPPAPEAPARDALAMASDELEEIELTTPAEEAFDDEFEPADTYAEADAMPPEVAPAAADEAAVAAPAPAGASPLAWFSPWSSPAGMPSVPPAADVGPTQALPAQTVAVPAEVAAIEILAEREAGQSDVAAIEIAPDETPSVPALESGELAEAAVLATTADAASTLVDEPMADDGVATVDVPMQQDTAAPQPPETHAAAMPPAVAEISEPALVAPQAVSAPPVVAVADDAAKWDAIAEEVRMQVLQRIDLFTDTGLREQLGMRLKPIVDRASADLVATINLHVGELLRAYVAEAIEREIENWRSNH